MTSYESAYANLYDVFYGDKPYEAEASFVDECIRRYGNGKKSLLELACGTGRHAIEFHKLGYDTLATDLAAGVLNVARSRAARSGSVIEFQQQDMRALDLGGRRFDAAICLFDALGYVQTNEGVADSLRGICSALQPGGIFLFEFWHAAAMLRSFDPVRVKEWRVNNRRIVRVSATELIVPQEIARVTYTIFDLRDDLSYSSFQEVHTARFFLLQEIRYFLETCGFTLLESFAGFSFDRLITSDTWHIVVVARKSD